MRRVQPPTEGIARNRLHGPTPACGVALVDRRRTLAFGLGLFAPSLPARGQARARRRIGFVTNQRPGLALDALLAELKAGLVKLGYDLGNDLALHLRHAPDGIEQTDAAIAEISSMPVDILIAQGAAVSRVALKPPPMPVLFVYSGDPISGGLAETLARPRGNMTGVTFMAADIMAKRVHLLREIKPGLRGFALLANPEHPGQHLERAVAEDAARQAGVSASFHQVRTPAELEQALAALAADPPDAILVFSDAFALQHRERIARAAAELGIPAVGGWEIFAESGFLFTYGPSRAESYRRLASYVDRILRGAKPSDLPIEQPRRFLLVINRKVAQRLGITLPAALLLAADEVIE